MTGLHCIRLGNVYAVSTTMHSVHLLINSFVLLKFKKGSTLVDILEYLNFFTWFTLKKKNNTKYLKTIFNYNSSTGYL